MTDIKQRLQKYLDLKGISAYRLEKDIGVARSYWGKCTNPTADIIERILLRYPELSAEYVLRSEEPILRTSHVANNGSMSADTINIDNSKHHNAVGNGSVVGDGTLVEVQLLRQQVEELRKDKEFLQSIISNMHKEVNS